MLPARMTYLPEYVLAVVFMVNRPPPVLVSTAAELPLMVKLAAEGSDSPVTLVRLVTSMVPPFGPIVTPRLTASVKPPASGRRVPPLIVTAFVRALVGTTPSARSPSKLRMPELIVKTDALALD